MMLEFNRLLEKKKKENYTRGTIYGKQFTVY